MCYGCDYKNNNSTVFTPIFEQMKDSLRTVLSRLLFLERLADGEISETRCHKSKCLRAPAWPATVFFMEVGVLRWRIFFGF